jgi:hypothetical protein
LYLSDLTQILAFARDFKGFTRKSQIGEITRIMGESQYDDAGILDLPELGGVKIVMSTDGIAEDLVKSDPWLAGYYSVLVNINDVLIKGAMPVGYVNVISSHNRENRLKIAQGIKAAIDKFDLRLLKGHTHPDSSFEAVDAAVVGIAKKVVRGTTARPGNPLVVAIDLEGSFGVKGWVKCYDSTVKKTKVEMGRVISRIISALESGYISASKDISAPGILGTLAMMCEASSVGATLDLAKIPLPNWFDLSEWLTSYPAMGYLFAINSEDALPLLRDAGLTAEVVGSFTKEKKIVASLQGQTQTFIDLEKESIFGLR